MEFSPMRIIRLRQFSFIVFNHLSANEICRCNNLLMLPIWLRIARGIGSVHSFVRDWVLCRPSQELLPSSFFQLHVPNVIRLPEYSCFPNVGFPKQTLWSNLWFHFELSAEGWRLVFNSIAMCRHAVLCTPQAYSVPVYRRVPGGSKIQSGAWMSDSQWCQKNHWGYYKDRQESRHRRQFEWTPQAQ